MAADHQFNDPGHALEVDDARSAIDARASEAAPVVVATTTERQPPYSAARPFGRAKDAVAL